MEFEGGDAEEKNGGSGGVQPDAVGGGLEQ